MKLLLLILLVSMAVFFVHFRQSEVRHHPRLSPPEETRRSLERARRDLQQAFAKSRHEARRVAAETHTEVRQALDEARDALHGAHHEVAVSLREAAAEIREAVDGIPVPIIPGTCVVEAVAQPPAVSELPSTPQAELAPDRKSVV